MTAKFWNEDNVARLRTAWETGGSAAALREFPDRTAKSLEQAAYTFHIKRIHAACPPSATARPTLEQRVVAIEAKLGIAAAVVVESRSPETKALAEQQVAPIVTVESPPPLVVPPSIAGRQVPPKPGPCDKGDQEYVRRRVDFMVHQLSSELKRTQDAIRTTVRDIVAREDRREPILRSNHLTDALKEATG